MNIQERMAASDNPFYAKFKRAQAGLPPAQPKPKPLVKEPVAPSSLDTTIGAPDWAKQEHKKPIARRPLSKIIPQTRLRRYKTMADKIRAEWKPTPQYPTYDDYLKAKAERMNRDKYWKEHW